MESTIATLIVIYVLCMAVFAVRAIKKRNEISRQTRARLSFTEALNPDESLLGRITPLVQYRNEKISVSKVYKRGEGSCTLYDCQISSSNRNSNQGRSSVLVMPGVDIPAFRLAPCMVKSGMFSGLVRKATQFALRQGGFSEVDTSHMPDFSAKYMLAAREPGKIRAEMPPEIWRELMAVSDALFIKAQGDTVIFAVVDVATMRKRGSTTGNEQERLEQAVRIASSLGRIFKSATRETAYSSWR